MTQIPLKQVDRGCFKYHNSDARFDLNVNEECAIKIRGQCLGSQSDLLGFKSRVVSSCNVVCPTPLPKSGRKDA